MRFLQPWPVGIQCRLVSNMLTYTILANPGEGGRGGGHFEIFDPRHFYRLNVQSRVLSPKRENDKSTSAYLFQNLYLDPLML